MVQTGAIVAIIFNIIVSFGLPLGAAIFLLAKLKRYAVRPILVGILVFLVMQMVVRIPLVMFVLPRTPAFAELMRYPISYGLFLGFTAGLAEEVGRWLGYKTLLHKRTDWETGVACGVGHAGLEAVMLVGLVNINDLIYALRINGGTFGEFAVELGPNLAHRIFTHLVRLEPLTAAMAGFERISVFFIQIAFSLMVLYGIKTKNALWLALAIFAHTFVDAPIVILPKVAIFNIYQIELFLGGCALLSLWYIVKPRKWLLTYETDKI